MSDQTTPSPSRAARAGAGVLLLGLTALLAGCASFSPDGGFAAVEQASRKHLGKEVRWARSAADQTLIDQRVAELLAKPLSADDAVQLALFNNRGLQAGFQDLGISEAEWVQAGRLPNPGFTFSRERSGGEVEYERTLHFSLARLLAMPQLRQIEQRRFAQTQTQVSATVLALAGDTRKAYYLALGAEESLRYAQQVNRAAQASAELARRMEQVGNFNKLQRARQQGFHADAALALARAEQVQRATRERLIRLMGLWGEQTAFKLPERLPDLPTAPLDQPDIERVAMAQRLDLQAARANAELTAKSLGLTKSTRFINVLELGLVHNSSNEGHRQRGWKIGFELPLFDWGGARVARAEAVYMQSLHRAAEVAVNARSEVREAYTAYRGAYDIARHHRDEIVPLRQRIAEENVLRYNGMLIGVFELLADARSQIGAVSAAIEAQRDFWLAQADLDQALLGKPSLGMMAPSSAAAADGGAAH